MVTLVVLSLACGAGRTVVLAAIITQVVPIIQLPATGELYRVLNQLLVRCEEVISRITVIVATQPTHLALEALR
jgi:hypothetical protein